MRFDRRAGERPVTRAPVIRPSPARPEASLARIEQQRIPPRPAGGSRGVDPVRRRAREVERLHEAPGTEDREARPVGRAGPAAPAREPASIAAPGTQYLQPLVGMSRDRVIAGLTRLEHAMARLESGAATAGRDAPATEMTLARTMLAEHLRRLRLVDVDRSGPFGGLR